MRKSSKARLFSTCLTGAILAASAPAWGQTSDAPVWKPRAEAEAQAGKDIGVSTSLFAPIAQNDSSLVYVDGRIGYDQRFDRNGSATIGARFRTGEDTAIGVNVGADFYRSDIGSRDQAAVSMGLEGFSSVFDVRVNYRLPLSKVRTIGFIDPNATTGAAALVLENNRLIERRSGFRLEAIPLQGFNGEAGVRLPVGDNASIRGSVGGFDYWDRRADESYRGVRGGLELDIEDRNSGFRFTFGGVVEHDNRFGTDARAHVRLSIPFGGRAGDRGAVPTGLDRQMGDRVRRDYVARSGSRFTDLTSSRFAVDARTGNQFGGFYYASGAGIAGAAGTLAAPTTIADAVSRAGTNGVVVALGSGGNINTGGVTLATDQYLVGGASAVDVRLLNGSTVQYALGGTNGVIVGTNAAGAAVNLGQGSVIRDLTVRGAGTGIAATGVGGFAIERVIVENTGGAGIALTNTLGSVALTGLTVRGGAGAGVLVNGGSNVSIANSTISGGAGAVDINDGGANLATALSNLTLSATGGNVLDIDGSGAGTVTVTGLSGITLRGGTGETGGLSVRSATFDASTATAGIQTVNAGRMEVGTTAARVSGQGVFLTDVTGSLSFADLDIANSGATGLRVVNSKVNSFTLATLDGTIDTVGGTAVDLDPLVINLNFATVASSGAAGPGVILDTVEGGGTGGNALTIGTLTVANSGGDGLVILNSTGLVRVNGGTITNSGGTSVRIGEQGVAGSGGSVNLVFAGSITDTSGAAPTVAIFNAGGTINFTGPISGSGGILVQDTLAGSAISFGAITLTGTVGDAIVLDRLAGSINFAGLVTIANPGANGIVIGSVPGGVTFGDVDITGLGNFNGVDVRNTQGTVLFNTLDITGTGAGTGINVTGSTNAGNVMTIAGSTIQGVNIGVDLTQANMTGQFRFGDGSPTPMNSTIAANVPLVIALMNASNGSYNFADANLVGDTSNLTGSGFTAYYAMVGATGAGTRDDPGSLAGADASSAQYIVLLNNPAGGQDVFDAADAGGSFDLAAGQSLVSFLTGDFISTGSVSLPANLVVTGIGPAGIANPFAGSGAAALTSTTAGSATINLANNSTIDGLVIRNAGGDVAVEGSGVSNVRIQNSNISGATGAISISDGGATSSVQLTHLDLASTSGTTLALSGAGAGALTVSGADIDIAATGSSAALSLTDVTSGGLGFGTVSTGASATAAVTAQNITGGNLVFGSIATGGTAAGAGVSISGSSGAVVVQSINASGTAGDAVNLTNNSGAITIGSISVSGSGADAVELTGNGAVTIGALTASGAGGAGLNIQDSHGTVTIAEGAISGAVTGVSIDGVDAGTGVSIGSLNLGGISGSGIALADVDGSVLFTGTTNITGIGTSGIVFGAGSAGSITFGDVNLIDLGAGRTGVDARTASGTISFNTLDITGISTTGTRGIDLRGATFSGSFATVDSGSITGVAIGVDLTNAAITGSFRDGDGSSTDADGAASTISAVVPIEIAGLNGAVGSYNFADVNLVGDTSRLVTSATTYFVAAGATGAGTMADPGSLAGAEASGAQIIVLLNNPAGGQDTLDAAGAGGSFDLSAGQSLLGFLNGDTLMLPTGGPANLVLYGITPGQIVNPFAGSGAPVLTNSTAGNALNLAANTLVDSIVIDAPNGFGVVGQYANTTIRNSHISAGSSAILIADAAMDTSVALSNLRLSSASGAVLDLDGTNAGTLTVTALDNITILGGNGEGAGFLGNDVVFDADLGTAGFQTVSGAMTIGTTLARVGGPGIQLSQARGDLDLDADLATLDTGANIAGAGGFRLALGGTIDVSNGVAYGLLLRDLSADVALSSLAYSGTGIAAGTQNVAGIGPAGRAIDIGALSVADGAANAITMTGTASGSFTFGAGSSIGTTTGAAILLSNSGASTFNYLGNVNYAGADALLSVSGGHSGAVNFGTGTLAASSGTGLVFQNADGTYSFTGAVTLNGGDAGIDVINGSAGSFSFGTSVSITSPSGTGINIADSTGSFTYLGGLTYATAGQAAISVLNHSGGAIRFQNGTLTATNGTGVRFDNADGTYEFTGPLALGGTSEGIRISTGSAGTFTFGAGTSIHSTLGGLVVLGSQANITYSGSLTSSAPAAPEVVRAASDQSTINLTAATFNVTGGLGISFDDADGTYQFGALALSGDARISIINGSSGTFTFGDVDISLFGAAPTAVTLTGAIGNVTFNTLDIAASSAVGTKGIDLTGNTGTGNIVVTNSSTITGVGIGVDLTNASRTGLFQYGDGSAPVGSTISATTPLVITGLNGATGTYNFADVNLVGDNSGLATTATVYYVRAGASGSGTLGDPGSLAGAEAATADIIILLNDPTGGQDVLDALGSNGNDTLQLDVNQALRSFRDGDTITLPGGAPANVILTGVVTGQVSNPYAGSGAPILTTTGAANTVTLANGNLIDGVLIQSASGFAGVYGSGVSGVTLSNATLSGAGTALRLLDGGAVATATLTNLSLSASGGNAALDLSGAGAGTLTVTGSGLDVSHSGAGALLAFDDIAIGAGGLAFGAVASTATGAGVSLDTIAGAGTLSFTSIGVAGASGTGVTLNGSSATVNLGNVTVSGATGPGLSLVANGGNITVGTVNVSASVTGISITGNTGTLTLGNGTIANASVAGILFGAGNTATIDFGNVDITALQANARGVDARNIDAGNITFATLDVSGATASGTRGIDLTGNTGTGDFIVTNGSTIIGVAVGVDLTNASRSGTFQYGDGESAIDRESTINATTPIVISGLNGATGSYNFADVNLVGDTSPLEASAFFVRAGAAGVGSASDPGSLAAADASTASYIVLLDSQAGAGSFDTLTGALTLANGQTLLSFRDADTFNVSGGAPANVIVYGITTGVINNPNAGSGAPVLTSTDVTGTVVLQGGNTVDGVVISNTGAGAGIYASGAAGSFVLRNSTVSGGGAAISLASGAATLDVNLQNLALANAGNQAGALLNLNGTGGTLTVTGMSNLAIGTAGGETAGLVFNTVTFDSDLATVGIQAVNAGALTIGTTGARVQGDGLSLTNVSGELTFSDLDIANNGGTGLLVANSKANNFLLTTLDGAIDTVGGTAINLDPLDVNITLSSVTATGGAYGILLDQVEGDFTVTGAVNVSGATTAGIAIQDNTAQVDALTAIFNGAVTINNTAGAGLLLNNNAGATISFAGGGSGVDVTTTSGTALSALAGGTISFAGSGNSLASGTGTALTLDGVTLGAAGVNFAGVTATGAASGVVLTSVIATGGGTINLGAVSLQGITNRGIDVNTALGTALSITDLDIGLNSTTAVALDLNGAALTAGIAANDFDVTNAAGAGTSIAVDLRGTTGAQTIRLGDIAAGGTASSIAGVGTGVYLNAATDATFTFGDGEAATDGTSSISAVTQIDASAAPAVGTYNFLDVTFGASPGLGFGVGRTLFVDADGAGGGGNGSGADGANPMTLAAAELALAATDVIVLINNGNAISAAGSNGNDTLALLADTQVRGFGQGALALTLTVPSTILLSSNTINISDPTGNGAATLTSAAGANVITLGASGNRISGFILDGAPAGALRGIVDAAGATGTIVNFMTISNFNQVGGYGVEITPSTSTTIDNVSFTGNTNDVLLNAAGSTITNVTATGATGTSITLNNATGTTTLTNVSITGAATGLSFTTPGGTIDANNVDITDSATSAITVSGGTANFDFDAASSIVQAAGGLVVNVTGNHSTGTFAYAGTINATSGAGMQFSNADGTYNFTGTTTLNGGDAGIDIYNGATGTFTFGSGTSLTHNGAGNAFVLLSSANLTFDGAIVDNDGVAVEIDGHDAGTATFNGAISSSIANASTVISVANSNGGAINFNGQMSIASTATVVSLSGNDGGTITFNAAGSGLDITSTTGTGMLITGGGTVNVQGGGNSIATTSGTLLSITNTGATATTANLAFASASNTGGANGIFVQRTAGSLGGTVNIGGGAITATTRGVSLTGDALTFTYGGTITTSGGTSRSVEATNRTGGVATLSGNIADTSLGISATNNTGGTLAFTGQTINLGTGANTAVTLANNTGATISFAPLGGGNGLDIVTTGGAGFSATGGGTVIVTGAGNSIQTATGQVLNLTGMSAGAGGINFASLQNTGTVAGIAINLNNLDAVGGGAFSGGTTSVAATSGGSDGIFVGNGSAANVSFGATTIGTGTVSGDGIEINGAGNGTVTFASVTINNTTGHGVAIVGAAGATGAISINGGTIGATGITGDGVNITGGGGNVTVAAAISKTNAGNVVEVSSHTGGAVSFSGNLSATGAAANGILLNNNSGGTIAFSGATKTINTGVNNAIQFDNTAGTGAAVSFTGGNLDIDTTTGRGITATSTMAGAGSLTITGSNNTIASVGGIALNLVNTNIAAGGLNFLSIAANGGARGIVLNNTGSTAGLTVTGTGTTDGSGGTIQNIGTRGLELINTAQVNISNLNLTNANNDINADTVGNDLVLTNANGAIYMSGVATAVFENINITGTTLDNGITGINVSNFQLNNSVIDNAGNGANESGIEFNNLSGTSSLTNTEIRFSETNSLDIVNTDVNLNLTLNNVTFRDTQSSGIGEGGLQFRSFSSAAGSPTTNIDVIDSDFLRLRTQGMQIIGEDDSTVSVDIVNNVIDSQADIGAGIDINGNDTATVNFNINNNTIQSRGGAGVNITSFLDANVMGRITGNTITVNGSGAGGSGVRVVAQETSQTIVGINTNNITAGAANNSSMIDLQARFDTARLDATLNGNTINSDPTAVADINITSGSSTAGESNQVYVDMTNNIIAAGGPTIQLRLRVSDLSNTNRLFLTGFVDGGAGIEDDAVATWNARGNTPAVTAASVNVSLTGTAIAPLAGTALTPTNPLP